MCCYRAVIIEPEYSVLDCDNFYRFDFMEDVSFQKKMVKGKRHMGRYTEVVQAEG